MNKGEELTLLSNFRMVKKTFGLDVIIPKDFMQVIETGTKILLHHLDQSSNKDLIT
jgi:hypothetical protein